MNQPAHRHLAMDLNPDRRCKCAEHTGQERWHGSVSGYTYHRCHCEGCRSGIATYYRDRYIPKPKRPKKPRIPYAEIPGGLVERRKKLWVAQGGLCAVCDRPVDFEKSHLDHDHACCDTRSATSCGSCDRGVVHPGCNTVLAIAGDDPNFLVMAIEYLVTNGKQRPVWLGLPEDTP